MKAIRTRHKVKLYGWLEQLAGRDLLCRIGRFLYLGSRRELFNHPEFNGEYALIGAVLCECRKDGMSPVLMDVGANLGDWTAAAIAVLGFETETIDGQVLAFEPAPDQRQAFADRHAGNIDSGTIRLSAAALGASPGSAVFEVTGSSSGDSAIRADAQPNAKTIEVEVTTIDAVLESGRIGHVAMAKIDTEGNDFNVILGARQSLAEQRIGIIQFEYNSRWVAFGHSLRNVFDLARQYDLCIGKLTAEAIEVYADWHPELERYFDTNFVLAPRAMLVRLPHRKMAFTSSNTVRVAG